jgi:hypothetical protein
MICKNCGYSTNGNFCAQCGQGISVDRINFSNFIKEVSESLFQVNKGFFHTLIALFIRPGISINDFLEGKRKNYFKPIAYVLTLSTLYFLIARITNQNTWMDDLVTGYMNGARGQNEAVEIPRVVTWFLKHYAYSTLILLPVFSLASYLSFFNFGKNYLEHIVVNAYITGQQALFYMLFALGGSVIDSEFMESIPVVLSVSYTFWVFWRLFSGGSRFMNIIRTLMTYLLYFIFSTGLLLMIMAIYME